MNLIFNFHANVQTAQLRQLLYNVLKLGQRLEGA